MKITMPGRSNRCARHSHFLKRMSERCKGRAMCAACRCLLSPQVPKGATRLPGRAVFRDQRRAGKKGEFPRMRDNQIHGNSIPKFHHSGLKFVENRAINLINIAQLPRYMSYVFPWLPLKQIQVRASTGGPLGSHCAGGCFEM